MSKKAIVLTTCLLVSMPIFAKGLISQHLMKSNQHSFVKSVEYPVNLSGLWVGKCTKPFEDENFSLNITQDDRNITIKFPDTDDQTKNPSEYTLKFSIKQVKSRSDSSSHSTEHFLSYALPSGPNSIFFSSHSVGMESSENSSSTYDSSVEFSLEWENDKLKFIIDNYPEDILCILDKQG